jgi:hypothetical protein
MPRLLSTAPDSADSPHQNRRQDSCLDGKCYGKLASFVAKLKEADISYRLSRHTGVSTATENGIESLTNANSLSLFHRDILISYFNECVNDPFGPVFGDRAWQLIKRRYVFNFNWSAFLWLCSCQMGICIVVVLTRFDSTLNVFSCIVGGLYWALLVFKGWKEIATTAFIRAPVLLDVFLRLNPKLECCRRYLLPFFVMYYAYYSSALALGSVAPRLNYCDMIMASSTCVISLCGISVGVSSQEAFVALTSIVAIQFVNRLGDQYIDSIFESVTVGKLVDRLFEKGEEYSNWHFFWSVWIGVGGMAFFIGVLVYPFITPNFLAYVH